MGSTPSGLSSFDQRQIYGLFLLSGISGLIYQIVWVRQFSYVFGNSVHSAAIVTALFMAGLGLGGWAAGKYIDSRFQSRNTLPLRGYAWFEIAIGVAALLTALVLPHLGPVSAAVSKYEVTANGWHTLSLGSNLLRYLVPVVLLTPVTALMGATLTLLIRFVVYNEIEHAGLRIGLLYGFNTAGAALGCLATDLVLIPLLGLLATQLLASIGNIAVGLLALRMARQLERNAHATSSEGSNDTEQVPPGTPEPSALAPWTNATLWGAMLAVLLSGAVGMGMEIVWFRYLISMLGGFREVFSLLLGTILVGMWLGASLAGILSRRFGNAVTLYGLAQTLLILSSAVPLMLLTRTGLLDWVNEWWSTFRGASGWLQSIAETTLMELIPIVGVTALPAVMMGMTFPLANAVVQDEATSVGRRAGVLYGANTLGAVLGALASGFWLLPNFGTQSSVSIWFCCSLLSLLPLFVVARASRRSRLTLGVAGAVALSAIALWLRLPADWLLVQSIPPDAKDDQILATSEGIGETIVISRGTHDLTLITNGHNMSATTISGQRYMRLFSHLPLLQAPQARDALVICFGVGNTLNATLLHRQLRRVDLVDISAHVLRHAHYFEPVNGLPLNDRRVSVFINDGRQHLRMVPPESYDLITAEPPPISHAGVAALYSREFYELVRSRLKPGGVMTHWLPIHQVPGPIGLSVVRAFLDVFPNATLLDGSDYQLILVGVNGPDPFQFDPIAAQTALAELPSVRRDLERVAAGSLLELAGLFVASSSTLQQATAGRAPVTDDYPIMEYFANRPLQGREAISGELFRPHADFDTWCPRCGDATLSADLSEIQPYLDVVAKLYASTAFLDSTGALNIKVNARQRDVILNSPYLRTIFSENTRKDR
jgi:predicted membrane-bound spermidine synthase